MALYYVYLTDETGQILTDETGALIYIDTYTKNPHPWRLTAIPKARIEWGITAKPTTYWRRKQSKAATTWRNS